MTSSSDCYSLKISGNDCQKYSCHQKLYFQYNIDKPANEEDYEDEDEDEDGFTGILIFHGRIHRYFIFKKFANNGFAGGARRPEVVEDDPIEGKC